MKKIRVGGVPEHFNLPWHLCIEEGDFNYENIDLEWIDFPDGTGAMNKALRKGDIDVAIILTEGIVKDISSGNPSRIIQSYIETPLIWGIHVDANSRFKSVEDLQDTKAAISREGSGSHLMAYVQAANMGWNIDNLKFEITGDIHGAVDALQNDKAQYFMWEKYTTKPWVDKGIFRRIGECPTPWSCFVVAAREEVINESEHDLAKMLGVVNAKSASLKEIPQIEETFSMRYGINIEDIVTWLNITSWSGHQLPVEEFHKVQKTLEELQLMPEKLPSTQFLYNLDVPI